MNFLRKKLILKTLALSMLFIFLQSIFLPSISFALTHGPHQPEYTSYEEPGTTDMVNLLTGDFTNSIPILDVPGPEGGFSLPLSYHGGIGLEQEASWVGLGWTLNPGAIVRNIVEFPDDANGESFRIHRQNYDIARGWTGTIPGIGRIGWDSNEGHYGTINILNLVGASYKNSAITDANVVGVHFNDQGVQVNPTGVALAAMTIASMGAGGAFSEGSSFVGAVAKKTVNGVVLPSILTFAFGVNSPDFNSGGYWELSTRKDKRLFHTNYWVWLDQTRYEDMYGTLYLGNMPANTNLPSNINPKLTPSTTNTPLYVNTGEFNDEGGASDMHYAWNGLAYQNTDNPTSLAKDNYSVMGTGISGGIEPYRLDVGTLSMPRNMSKEHIRIAAAPFNSNDFATTATDYKVQFKYRGTPSNTYYHHVGGTSGGSGYTFNLNDIKYGIVRNVTSTDPNTNRLLRYSFNDPILQNFNTLIEGDRTGLNNKKLSQGKQVEWFTNKEIIDGADILECFSPGERNQLISNFDSGIEFPVSIFSGNRIFLGKNSVNYFAISDPVKISGVIVCSNGVEAGFNFNTTVTNIGVDYIDLSTVQYPACSPIAIRDFKVTLENTEVSNSTIGGYKITREDGMTYHYALPVFDWANYTYIENVTDADDITEMVRPEPFASTWLLTAITGPDYVDRGGTSNAPNGRIDPEDWGYWVKLDYGKFSSDYDWRMPYEGKRRTSNNQFDTFTRGKRQQYYLNSIQTRSHIALFVKDLRKDARGANENSTQPDAASSLRLDEIVLLSNTDYEDLVQSSGLSFGPNNPTDFTLLDSGDSFDEVLDVADVSTITNTIYAKALRRIKFNHTYNLCKAALNSFEVNGRGQMINQAALGKLTLESIATYGTSNSKVMPDYTFDYLNNFNYDQHKWDGWGAYNSGGTSSGTTHTSSSSETNGRAWSLYRITTPLGGEVEVSYERDTYAKISEFRVTDLRANINFNSQPLGVDDRQNGKIITNSGGFQVGDKVFIEGNVNYKCNSSEPAATQKSYSGEFIVNQVGPNYIEIGSDYMNLHCDPIEADIFIFSNIGTVSRLIDNKKGGNIRVSAITTRDENGNAYKTRYLYQNDEGISSGVVAQEPDYIRNRSYDFYDYYDYPNTPVMYSQVTILRGNLTTDNDYHTRQVYRFQMPESNMVQLNEEEIFDGLLVQDANVSNPWWGSASITVVREYLKQKKFTVDDRTSGIGQMTSVKTFDKQNNTVASTEMNYLEAVPGGTYQGTFTEGSLMIEKVIPNPIVLDPFATLENQYHRAFRTTKRYYPTILHKVITTKDGLVTTVDNKTWDFITGNVLEAETTNPFGLKTLTETVPAYHHYATMGPLTENPDNKHMLAQVAASYTYKMNDTGIKVGLISAGAQTWKKNWSNYREYNAASGYYDGNEGPDIWRKSESYVWRGKPQNIQADGTYYFFSGLGFPDERDDFDKYDFTTSINPGWLKNEEFVRYDHYSMPVEVVDNQGRYASTKMGYDQTLGITGAGNARYNEITFSGAEDLLSNGYFGGEVKLQDGIRGHKVDNSFKVHTGDWSVNLTAGKTFVFNSSDLQSGRKYRAMVWTTATGGKIQYQINGGTIQTINVNTTLRSGDWYLVDGIIDAGAGGNIEIWCQGVGTSIYYDDFRFHPVDIGSAAYVFNDKDELEYVLDNNNFYTRYTYDNAGIQIASYVEVLSANPLQKEKITRESQYNYARD